MVMCNFLAAGPTVAIVEITVDFMGPPGPTFAKHIAKVAYFFTSTALLQGIGNLIWMPLFLRLKRPIEATIDVVALTGIVGYLTYIWGQVDEVAGWALAPYLGWLGFATYLSAGAGYLNNWSFEGKERPVKKKWFGIW